MRENLSDHDLLVTLNERVEQVRADIRDLKDDTGSRLKRVEVDMYEPSGVVERLRGQIGKVDHSNARFLIITGIYSAIGATMVGLILFHIFNP